MAELKPCPFCGGQNISIRIYDPFDGYQGDLSVHRVWCRNCGAQNERKNVMDAIEAWNKRAESKELEFTRKFIHDCGLEFALASAWNRRAEDGE